VKPQIIPNYDGKDIVLNIAKYYFVPWLFQRIITIQRTNTNTDGTTLLGADDKAGITEIVTAMEF
jgi:tripeptide aminopeptidase